MKKKILVFILCLATFMGVIVPSGNVFAEDPPADGGESCDIEFLGLRPWHYGLNKDEKCNVIIKTDCHSGQTDCDITAATDTLAHEIWVIILNVLVDLLTIAGMVALGFVIYGGYLFLRSGGDVAFATKGRKTLTTALVGLLIVTLANVISRLIVTVLTAK